MSQIVNKPWGREIVLTDSNLPYVGKILEIKAGARLSLQYHDKKTETLTLVKGEANITINSDTQSMTPYTSYTITPNTIHRISATTDSQIFEVSTPLAGKTTRLEDDYQRGDETL